MLHIKARLLIGVAAFALAAQASVGPSRADDPFTFTTGDLVVSVEGNGVEGAPGGPYTDNQAAPLSLFEFAPDGTSAPATYVGALVLPQTAQGANSPVSGEYGSSSEGALQLSGNGKYLTIMGYGVNAAGVQRRSREIQLDRKSGARAIGEPDRASRIPRFRAWSR